MAIYHAGLKPGVKKQYRAYGSAFEIENLKPSNRAAVFLADMLLKN